MTDAIFDLPCLQFVGAVGHHAHFVENADARARIERFCAEIRTEGAAACLEREYPPGSEKTIIVNVVGRRADHPGIPCVVDGNAHLLACCMCLESLTLRKLVETSERPGIVRVWYDGWEEGSGQSAPYDTYVPVETDTRRIPRAYTAIDYFKEPPAPTKVIPSTIAFSSPLFSWRDRGRTLAETATALLGEAASDSQGGHRSCFERPGHSNIG